MPIAMSVPTARSAEPSRVRSVFGVCGLLWRVDMVWLLLVVVVVVVQRIGVGELGRRLR